MVDAANFSLVARSQSVAVSSVTRKVDALEVVLGAKLFRRSPRSVTLTDAGTQYLTSARKIVAEFDEAKANLAGWWHPQRSGGVVSCRSP